MYAGTCFYLLKKRQKILTRLLTAFHLCTNLQICWVSASEWRFPSSFDPADTYGSEMELISRGCS